jgi:hypothetical protein
MAIGIAVLAALAFLVWIIVRAIRSKSVKAHFIAYGVAIVSGVFTYGYFLSLDFPQLIKIVASIILGIILIILGSLYQRRVAGR